MDDDENNTRYLAVAKIMREKKEAKEKTLSTFSIQELVEEMCKRESVKLYGPYDELTHYKLEGKGPATILVIKK